MSLQVFQVSLGKAAVAALAASTLANFPALAQSTPGSTTVPTAPVEAPNSTTDPVVPSANPTKPVTPASETTTPKTTSTGTIVDVAASNGSFKTLVAAIKAADLADVLSGEGPYTVFAPTDKAFAALPKGTVETLLKPENKEMLRKVLTYHVLPGKVASTAIKSGQVETVEGSSVALAVKGKNVTVNNAKVTKPDIQASNGVIHIIDRVILPPNL